MEESKGIIFSRPPRFLPEIPSGEVEIPSPPSNQSKPEINWISILLPPIVMIAGSMSLVVIMGRNPMYMMVSIATTSVSIFIALLNATKQIKNYKSYIKKRNTKYLQLISDLRGELEIGRNQQISAMNDINPSPAVCLERIFNIESKLWERTPAHTDFLSIRMGIGSIPTTLKPKYQKAQLQLDVDPLQDEPEKLGKEFEMASSVPVCLDIIKSEISGIAGTKEEVNELLKTMILQIITNQSYQDVKIVLIIKEEELSQWDWIKRIPHVWDDSFSIRFIICGPIIAHNTLGAIFEDLKAREAKKDDNQYSYKGMSQYLFVVTDPEVLEEEPIAKYLYSGHAYMGVTSIFTSERKEFLPMHCKSVVTIQGKVGTYAYKESTKQIQFNVDKVDQALLEKVGRVLAPIRLKKGTNHFTLPKSITLLDMLGAKTVQDVPLMQNWTTNKTYNGMGVPIGARVGGELFNLDMQAYETSHGPHGLVAGTTGSGKSELLQSIIISLAINFHPYDVVFVLIDYKGGGMADVFKGMPHLVGTITNLGGNQTNRALVSIKSELKRRQHIFSEHEVNNIDKYQKLFHAGKAKEPMPHLIMIADEFAELKAEQPEFMKELVSTARVGRSLGVHLILATQKPAGVVDDQIWSNSRFKICLKVQDESDSKDVIKRPDAAKIKEPGRGYIQVGNDEIFEMFQSAFSGADYDPAMGTANKKEENKVFKIGLDGRKQQIYPLFKEHVDKIEKDSQLKAMVEQITKVAQQNGIEGLKGPWLPPLEENLHLNDTDVEISDTTAGQKEVWENSDEGLVATIGIVDDPKAQCQENLLIDFLNGGNLLVYGAAGTGKTVLLESIMMSLAYRYSPKQFNLYIMDFGGGTLKKYTRLPHCGGVMGIEEEDKLYQFILFISRIIEERKEALERELAPNMKEYNTMVEDKIPYIIIIIDNYFALTETYEDINENVMGLVRDGLKYGIYFIVTATSSVLIRYKFSINFKQNIALQLLDNSEYSNIVGRTEGLFPDKVVGRGLVAKDYPVEFQTSLPYKNNSSIVNDIKWVESIESDVRAVQIPNMPDKVDLLKINEANKTDELSIGLNQNDLQPVKIDLKTQYVLMVVGASQSGKSTTIISWVKAMWLIAGGKDRCMTCIADSGNMGLYSIMQETGCININETPGLMGEIIKLMELRQNQLNEHRLKQLSLEALYDSWKQFIIVIDNIVEYAEGADSNFAKAMELIIKKGYGLRITVVVGGDEDEISKSWDKVIKTIKGVQTGVLLGSIKEQSLYGVRVSARSYEKELEWGDGYYIIKNKYTPLRFGQTQ